MKCECYLLLCCWCHGSFWSLLWCWLMCSSRCLSMEFHGDAHMFCVVLQHTPAVFGACCEDWTDVDCKCDSMSLAGVSSSYMSISIAKINQIKFKCCFVSRENWVCKLVRSEPCLALETDWRNGQVSNSDRAWALMLSWICVSFGFNSTSCCCHLEWDVGSGNQLFFIGCEK